MNYIKPILPFSIAWAILLITPAFSDLVLFNTGAQLVLFIFIVCIPAWKTGRMSYVDIGWPLGVAVIGLVTFLYAEGDLLHKSIVCAMYAFIGLRMGLAAIGMWRKGHIDKELPRYQYQRRRWQKAGIKNTPLIMQIEALMQGFANASFLAFPAFIIAVNPNPNVSILEIIGVIVWLGAYSMESVADVQKVAFLKKMKQEGKKNMVCNVGLWRYSRHPNYFAEWMVWNGLIIAAIPSWLYMFNSSENIVLTILLGIGLVFLSRVMYTTLVYYSGAVPAEYYSVQKRPDYKNYQEQTNRFFPGPVKR
jgi:steroid 5-alpha reductase family enzyme